MNKKIFIPIIVVLIVVFTIRIWIYYEKNNYFENGEELKIETRLVDDPDIRNGNQQFRIKTDNGQKIYITTGLSPIYKYGYKIKIEGKIKEKVYDDYSIFTMSYPSLQIDNNDHNFIARSATIIRQKTDILYQKTLSPVSAGLLAGIVFGGDRNLPKEFSDDLRVSGVTHVIAASGMNVTFVASFLMGVFVHIFKRQIAITIAIFGIFFYAFIAGFEPSIVRAAIMGSIVFSARLLGRQNLAIASLVTTVYIMLFYNPSFIADVGFQLSVAATAGIVLLKPIIDHGFVKLGRVGEIGKEDIGTTIAAQTTTLPILLGTFGSYGLLSILVNALVLWTIPILMVIGALGLIFGAVFEPLGQLIILASAPLLFYFEKVVSYFANFDTTVSIMDVSTSIWIGYYMILGAFIHFMSTKNSKVEAKNKNAT